MSEKLLQVTNLNVTFHTEQGNLLTVSDINFSIEAGEIFCLVGESGCGKSLTAKAILGLTPENSTVEGQILLKTQDVQKNLPAIRGKQISMIFQEPMTALNPVLRIGDQCTEHMILHDKISKQQALLRCIDLFEQVGISAASKRLKDYPHQLSGGMRQRVMIAMALACSPQLLLADEPTTALDVTIQWQILSLMQNLSHSRGMGILLITHDLGVVAQVAHKVGVMYAGQMVEYGLVENVLKNPKHPYTQGLLHAIPSKHSMDIKFLPTIEGRVPLPSELPSGCRFHPRCPFTMQQCKIKEHKLEVLDAHNQHQLRCYLAEK